VTNETANANVNIAHTLPWFGTNYTAAFNNGRTNTTSTFATLNPQFTTQLTATVTQPLLRDFKIDNTRNQLLTGTITRQVTDITLRTRITNLTATTKNAYWDLLAAIRAIEAAKQSLALAEKLIEDNRVRVEVGTLAPMDIISAQAEAATRRQTLTSAEATRRTAELVLKRLIVSETTDPVWRASIDPIDMVQVRPITINLESAVTSALDQRTDLLTAKKNLESSDVNIRYLRNQMMPALNATATLGTRGLGGNQFIREGNVVVGTIPGGWPEAFAMMRQFEYPNWTIGAPSRTRWARAPGSVVRPGETPVPTIAVPDSRAGIDRGDRGDQRGAARREHAAQHGGGPRRPGASGKAPGERTEQVRSRHVDQLLRRPGAA